MNGAAGAGADGAVWAVVLAGGGGSRFGGLKQFATLGGQTLLGRVVGLAERLTDGVVVVLPAGHTWTGPGRRATGGATRAESVRAGLAALPDGVEVVVISDPAHPLASPVLYATVIAAVRAGADGALPGLPLVDAVKRLEPIESQDDESQDDESQGAESQGAESQGGQGQGGALLGLAGATTPAGGSVSAQMPMAFRLAALRRAHQRIGDAVEDSAMVTAAGGRVVVVPGEATNVHVTTPAELAVAAALLPLVDRAPHLNEG